MGLTGEFDGIDANRKLFLSNRTAPEFRAIFKLSL